jgi:hypothetical protein
MGSLRVRGGGGAIGRHFPDPRMLPFDAFAVGAATHTEKPVISIANFGR